MLRSRFQLQLPDLWGEKATECVRLPFWCIASPQARLGQLTRGALWKRHLANPGQFTGDLGALDNHTGMWTRPDAHHFIFGQTQCPVVGRRPQHAVSKLACLTMSPTRSCPSSIVHVFSSSSGWSPFSSFSCMVSKW